MTTIRIPAQVMYLRLNLMKNYIVSSRDPNAFARDSSGDITFYVYDESDKLKVVMAQINLWPLVILLVKLHGRYRIVWF